MVIVTEPSGFRATENYHCTENVLYQGVSQLYIVFFSYSGKELTSCSGGIGWFGK